MRLMRLLVCLMAIIFTPVSASAEFLQADEVAAVRAADNGWDAALALAEDASPVAQDVVTWMRLRAGEGDVPLADFAAFLARRADWPRLDRVRRGGEASITDDTPAAEIVAYFADVAPQTGVGVVAYVAALRETGQEDAADAAMRQAWLELRLTEKGHNAMVAAFGEALAPFHVARTDALLWRWRREEAARMLPLLPEDQRALANARLGYLRKASDIAARVEAVPPALRGDPGLAYDRYNWLADRGARTEAVKILRDRSTSGAALGEPFRWSGWRRSLARWEMREGRPEQAYLLASRHYLSEGASYADLEWLSGYLSLTYLDDPAQALAHFETALGAVETPISVSRMQYWIGRTQTVLGNPDKARTAYAAAAEHQTAFYGLLASEKVGRPLSRDWAEVQPIPASDVFEQDLTKAAFLLLAAGERGHAVSFFAELGATLEAAPLASVGATLDALDEQYYTLLLGKRALRRGIMVPQNYFPLHDLATLDLPVDGALALSIARRESEFNIGIGSPVGALGLMQLMPATAQEVAGFLDLPYSRARLTTDWEYNATLGAKYLEVLQEEFGPSPVMIAAGYNAGPSRPKSWMDARGDPRLQEMDVVDWIEHIPFRETRNYVMRVTESIPIYEARLSGNAGPVAFTTLLIGEKPLLRPIARPAR